MTPQNIDRLAREAGLSIITENDLGVRIDGLDRFAAAVLEEAAKVCERLDCAHRCGVGHEITTAIRAMKDKP